VYTVGLLRRELLQGCALDGKILSLYARGMSVRDIQDQLQDLYGVEVSSGLISKVTDGVDEARKLWQSRPLERLYPIVYFVNGLPRCH
jgi:putative transposase